MLHGKTFHYFGQIDFDLLDAGQVVHHPNYFVLCERARSESLRLSEIPPEKLWEEQLGFAVTEIEAEFKRPLRWGSRYCILVRATDVGASRFRVWHQIVPWEKPLQPCFYGENLPETQGYYFQATLTLVAIDLGKFKPVRLEGISGMAGKFHRATFSEL